MSRTPKMTNLKCPFCGQGLYECEVSSKNPRESYFACPNYDCEATSGMVGTENIWKELIYCSINLKNMREFLEEIEDGNIDSLNLMTKAHEILKG